MATTEKLHPDEFVDLAPTEPGTVHKHHCKQGRNNDRMYITRKEDDTILAYCHHCGGSGRYSVLGNRVLKASKGNKESENGGTNTGTELHNTDSRTDGPGHSDADTSGRSVSVQSGFVPRGRAEVNPENWPTHAKKWWYEYGLTKEQANTDAGACYWPDEDALGYLHVGGTQYRFFGKDAPLKYRTVKSQGDTKDFSIFNPSKNRRLLQLPYRKGLRPLILVEDARSALKLSNYCPTIALGGVNPSEKFMSDLIGFLSKDTEIIVWLDNDNPEVIKVSRQLADRLKAVGFMAYRVSEGQCTLDPKEVAWEAIYDIIKGLLNGT